MLWDRNLTANSGLSRYNREVFIGRAGGFVPVGADYEWVGMYWFKNQ